MSGKQRNLRKRRALDEQEELPDEDGTAADGEEGGQPRLTAEEIRLLQKQRQRVGVRAALLRLLGALRRLRPPLPQGTLATRRAACAGCQRCS